MWTLIEGFKHLSEEEFDLLVEAPALITVLIGASDGELDREERTWSERLLRSRTYNNPKSLNNYYRVVAEGFWARVQGAMAHLPAGVQARNEEISKRLSALNPVLAKLDPSIAAALYKGFLGLAEETAEASGGFLRIGAIGAEEAKWVHLPMLTPVEMPEKGGPQTDS
jgi:hypothetical protein